MSALLQIPADQWKIILAYVGKKVLQGLINIRGDLYPSYEVRDSLNTLELRRNADATQLSDSTVDGSCGAFFDARELAGFRGGKKGQCE